MTTTRLIKSLCFSYLVDVQYLVFRTNVTIFYKKRPLTAFSTVNIFYMFSPLTGITTVSIFYTFVIFVCGMNAANEYNNVLWSY